MFTNAIAIAAQFTRPVHSISRNYGSTIIQPGAATLFFVNSDGWALTCGHVANQLTVADAIAQKATAFQTELSSFRGKQKERKIERQLEKKYGYTKDITFELLNLFINCVEGNLRFKIIKHNK